MIEQIEFDLNGIQVGALTQDQEMIVVSRSGDLGIRG